MTTMLPFFFVLAAVLCALMAGLQLHARKMPGDLLSPSATWLLASVLFAMAGLAAEAAVL